MARDPWAGYDAWKTTNPADEAASEASSAFERWKEDNPRWRVTCCEAGAKEVWEFDPSKDHDECPECGKALMAEDVVLAERTWEEFLKDNDPADAYDGPDTMEERDG